jgi:hypothetical protein
MTAQEYRGWFNANWTPEKYRDFLHRVAEVCGVAPGFRQSETPCFFERDLLDRLAVAGSELIGQLMTPKYRAISNDAIPPQYCVPNEASHPMFVQADFGLIRNAAGGLEPRLVEIQGFPSLYAYQPALARAYIDAYGIPGLTQTWLDNLDPSSYRVLLGEAILGGHDPEEVILLEVDPYHQKTLCDFLLTQKVFGVDPVCITSLKKQGNRLYREKAGRLVPVRRIYNRCIVDELERRAIAIPFDWRDELDVEWAGHPNYYFRISKFSIPHLNHPSVPETHYLDGMDHWPENLDEWVLKPLYSFAGLGVSVGPQREELDAIPPNERRRWILQRRQRFTPAVETPHGPTMAEVRVMYIWTDRLRPVTNIVRMGRGKMMGVDHNKNMEWVGASAALYPVPE